MNTPEPPAPLEPSPADDARIERMLRDSSPTYIEDAGFTARIMGALPSPQRRADRRRSVLLLGAVLLGCGHVAVFGGSSLVALVATIIEQLAAWSVLPVPVLGTTFTVGVLACWVMVLAAGWWGWARTR
jgi:hypothetical protein